VAVRVHAGEHVVAGDLGGRGDQARRHAARRRARAGVGGVEQAADDHAEARRLRVEHARGVAPGQAVVGVDAQRALDLGERAGLIAAVEHEQGEPARRRGVAGLKCQALAVRVLGLGACRRLVGAQRAVQELQAGAIGRRELLADRGLDQRRELGDEGRAIARRWLARLALEPAQPDRRAVAEPGENLIDRAIGDRRIARRLSSRQ